MRMHWKSVLPALAAVAVATGGVVVPTGTAEASVSQGFISGAGIVTDDWGDEGPLSSTSHANSNATYLWQMVLWADGYLTGAGVDCSFGPATTAATRRWQTAHHLTADGVVGPRTLGTADDYLVDEGLNNGVNQVRYMGVLHNPPFLRRSNNFYQVTDEGYYLSYTEVDPRCG